LALETTAAEAHSVDPAEPCVEMSAPADASLDCAAALSEEPLEFADVSWL
jgi:hypothetical protein